MYEYIKLLVLLNVPGLRISYDAATPVTDICKRLHMCQVCTFLNNNKRIARHLSDYQRLQNQDNAI